MKIQCNLQTISGPNIGFGFSGELRRMKIAESMNSVNVKLQELRQVTSNEIINIFEVIDFRMLSGLLGEALVSELADNNRCLRKNPNIDGYPDLCSVTNKEEQECFDYWNQHDASSFIKYRFGGIEVKNTFGTKRSRMLLEPGETRINKINRKPDWKAHHTYTNSLLATMSDFIDGIPQLTMAFFASDLIEDDWTNKQNPKKGSAMTSFSVMKSTGWLKLKANPIVVLDEPDYWNFLE